MVWRNSQTDEEFDTHEIDAQEIQRFSYKELSTLEKVIKTNNKKLSEKAYLT